VQTLDLSVMRTLMAVVETGSFARAARRVGRSESAVSLQMKRLEEQLGEAVFLRTGKRMALTEAGATLLGYAQRLLDLNDEALSATSGASLNGSVTLAVPHDVAETWLPAVVEGFSRSHPSVALRTVEGRSTAVLERLAAGEIDLAVAFSATRPEDALWSGCLPMIWIGPRDFVSKRNSPVQLAVFDPPCAFRSAATATLDQAGIDWSVAYSSSSLSDLWAAVNIGLGVTVRTPAALPPGLAILGRDAGLPDLPPLFISLYGKNDPAEAPVVDRLRALLQESLETCLGAAM
jgi:DNA-binding transcriptional LysR family regulator